MFTSIKQNLVGCAHKGDSTILGKSRQERKSELWPMSKGNREVINCHKVCPLTYTVLGMWTCDCEVWWYHNLSGKWKKWASPNSNVIFLLSSRSFMLAYIFGICVSCIQYCIKLRQCFLREKQQIIIPFDRCIYTLISWDIMVEVMFTPIKQNLVGCAHKGDST